MIALLLVMLVVTLLVSAKAHGQQLRLERELAGYWDVTFGGGNAPFVEALWRRERWWFWGIALGITLLGFAWLTALAVHVAGTWTVMGYLWLMLLPIALAAMGAAFVATGLASVVRFERARPTSKYDSEWLQRARIAMATWWGLSAATCVACGVVFARMLN